MRAITDARTGEHFPRFAEAPISGAQPHALCESNYSVSMDERPNHCTLRVVVLPSSLEISEQLSIRKCPRPYR